MDPSVVSSYLPYQSVLSWIWFLFRLILRYSFAQHEWWTHNQTYRKKLKCLNLSTNNDLKNWCLKVSGAGIRVEEVSMATLILTSEITQTQMLAIKLQTDGLCLGLTGQFMIKAGWAFNFLDMLEKLGNISRNLTPCNKHYLSLREQQKKKLLCSTRVLIHWSHLSHSVPLFKKTSNVFTVLNYQLCKTLNKTVDRKRQCLLLVISSLLWWGEKKIVH